MLQQTGLKNGILRDDRICSDIDLYLDFSGIAKGYIGDQLVKLAITNELPIVLIDLGGDIVAGRAPPGQNGWTIEHPVTQKRIQIEHAAICTSGDQYQYFVHKGVRYSHIVHPQFGYPVAESRSCTVISSKGSLADAYATVFCIAEKKEVLRMAEEQNLGVSFITAKEKFQNNRFTKYIIE